MSRNAIETVMGAVVLVVAAVFLFFAYRTSQVRAVTGYDISAVFDRVGGLREGSEVKVNGITVGSIVSQSLDTKDGSFTAVVKMSIDNSIQLPVDSQATIASSGLLGDRFLKIVPGFEKETIKPGGMIAFTTPPVEIEDLIGKYIFSLQGGGQGGGGQGGQKPEAGGGPSASNGQKPDGGNK
jgi:phospholipid/cholesterol/gamma-HCH transport system substrate-binding protein